MRGKGTHERIAEYFDGITPAYAGKSRERVYTSSSG